MSPDFKLLLQNNISDTILLDLPLIWIMIVHTILFPLVTTILKQILKQDFVKLNLTQLDNNYTKYLETSFTLACCSVLTVMVSKSTP